MNTKLRKVQIITLVVASIVIAAALLWFIPRSTRIDYTLTTSKIDRFGKEIGTTEIRIAGRKLDYLFQDSRVDFTIAPFDGLVWLKPALHANTNQEGHLETAMENDILYTFYYGAHENFSSHDGMTQLRLGFSPDMDRWIIINDSDRFYYVASISGEYSAQELVEYFSILIPAN